MLQLLSGNNALTPNSYKPKEILNTICTHIENNYCKNISIDISHLNIIDACYISSFCSAKHFIKYPNGSIKWRVSSKLVEEFNKDLDLGNNTYEY